MEERDRGVDGPLAERVLDLLEEAQNLYDAVMARKVQGGDAVQVAGAAVEAYVKLKRILQELGSVASRGGPVVQAKAREAQVRVEGWNKVLLKQCLGLSL